MLASGGHGRERGSQVTEDESEVVVRPEALEELVSALLAEAGLEHDGAALTARGLVQTNLWGIDSHGVLRVGAYVARLRAGGINGLAQPRVVRTQGALALIDGQNGCGFVVGTAAMQEALALARRHGVGVVAAINSNHFGAAGLYARLAADADLIGIAMTNVAPNVVAPGGVRPVVGNNPLAISAPTDSGFPFAIDVSLSAVSGGKLLLASRKGERIPLDWATDRDGRPTDDPEAGFAGFLLPMGGFKGLGLAYAVDILCGVMTGGSFGSDLRGTYAGVGTPSRTGHLMIALDPGMLIERDELQARMTRFVEMIRATPLRDPDDEMLLPGELEHRTEERRRRSGIPLPRRLYDELLSLAEQAGAPTRLETSAG